MPLLFYSQNYLFSTEAHIVSYRHLYNFGKSSIWTHNRKYIWLWWHFEIFIQHSPKANHLRVCVFEFCVWQTHKKLCIIYVCMSVIFFIILGLGAAQFFFCLVNIFALACDSQVASEWMWVLADILYLQA